MFNRLNKSIKNLANKRKTTIKDIANVLGLTPSAVSKALSDHPRISDKTKTAVKEIAKKLGNQPNYLASALRKGKSNLVGVMIPRNNSSFFSSVVENIEEVLNRKGYNIIITQSNESYNKECSNIDALLQIQVDGVIASIANETTNLDHYIKIKSKGIPLIMFDRGEDTLGVDYVGIDDYNSSQKIVQHLVEQGCQRIAHLGGFEHSRIYKNRRRGYKEGLEKFGLPFDETLLFECNLTIEDGRRIMKKLLQSDHKPDAIYAAGDYAALGALQVLQENNIEIPNEIALVGFSNAPFTSLVNPSITTINQNSDEIGKMAAQTFLQRIKSPLKDEKWHKIILDTQLIVRNSSKRKGLNSPPK